MAEIHPLRSKSHISTGEFGLLEKEAELRCKEMLKNNQQAPMPKLNHLKSKDYDNVYEPSDDTYLLLDAIYLEFELNKAHISRNLQNINTLEVGCGTGVATILLGQILRRSLFVNMNENCSNDQDCTNMKKCKHYITDINEYALNIAIQTAEVNSIPRDEIKSVQCDLAEAFLGEGIEGNCMPNLENKVDVLIFNPPYVPTPDEEVGSSGIEASWAGGKDGRVVVDRFLPQINPLLKDDGTAFLITVDDNYPEKIAQLLKASYQLDMKPWLRKKVQIWV